MLFTQGNAALHRMGHEPNGRKIRMQAAGLATFDTAAMALPPTSWPTPLPFEDHPGPGGPPNPFERLVQIMKENDDLLAALRQLGARLAQARAYLAEPGCNAALGNANLLRVKTKHSCVLVLLRANRIEAQRILAEAEGPATRRAR